MFLSVNEGANEGSGGVVGGGAENTIRYLRSNLTYWYINSFIIFIFIIYKLVYIFQMVMMVVLKTVDHVQKIAFFVHEGRDVSMA